MNKNAVKKRKTKQFTHYSKETNEIAKLTQQSLAKSAKHNHNSKAKKTHWVTTNYRISIHCIIRFYERVLERNISETFLTPPEIESIAKTIVSFLPPIESLPDGVYTIMDNYKIAVRDHVCTTLYKAKG